VISRITTSKNHIELLAPVRSETGFVILRKFWSGYDLQNFQKQKILGDDQGELSKLTVSLGELTEIFFLEVFSF
jgi:hypothetical protein